MKVSIITATYNSAGTIKDTVQSVNVQRYNNIEHIIVDGASTDNTLDIIRNSKHSGPVISEKDNGIYDAMNKGIKRATGDIIGILNSDDFYSDADVIKKVAKVFEETGCDAVYGDLLFVDKEVKSVVRKWVAGDYNRKEFYKGWMPPHPTFFVRKEVYQKFGCFNLNFKSSSDYELLLRLMLVNEINVQYVPGVMVHMRVGGYSNSSLRNRLAAHIEDYKAWRSNRISPRWYTLTMKPLRKMVQFTDALFPALQLPGLSPSVSFSNSLYNSLFLNRRVVISYALLLTSLIKMTPLSQ